MISMICSLAPSFQCVIYEILQRLQILCIQIPVFSIFVVSISIFNEFFLTPCLT